MKRHGRLLAVAATWFVLGWFGLCSPTQGESLNVQLMREFSSPVTTPDTAHFGNSAIDRGTAIIGLHGQLGDASTYPGDAFIYDTNTWTLQLRVNPSDPTAGDWFGKSVDARNGLALVTAPGKDVGTWHAGSAYVFNASTGQQVRKLISQAPAYCDWFGWTGALGGDNAYIGACQGPWGSSNPGRVEVYNAMTGAYRGTLQGDAASRWFGMSIAAKNQIVAVGDWGTGAVYVYDVGTNQRVAKVAADGPIPHFFGTSVAVDGSQVLVGTIEDGPAGQYVGSAYLFDWTTGQLLHKFVPQDAHGYDYYGSSLALTDGKAIIGASHPYGDAGAVYICDAASGVQLAKVMPPDGQPGDMFGWNVSADDEKMLVTAVRALGHQGKPYGVDYAYAIPEPAMVYLLALGGLMVCRRRT